MALFYLVGCVFTLAVLREHQLVKTPLTKKQSIIQGLRSSTSRVPGPWYTKYTSLVLDFHWITATRTGYVHRLHQLYGPVVRIAPNEVAVSDMEAVKTIYSTKETFRKSDFYQRLVTNGTESLFSTVDVDFHRRHRRLLAGPMSESSLKGMAPQVEARVDLAISRIAEEMKGRGSADVFKWWLFMATDVIGQLTFGDSFRMLELGQKNDYARELERVNRLSALRSTFPYLVRFSGIVPLPIFRRAMEASVNLRRYAGDSLRRYRRLVEDDPNLAQETLFTKLFRAETDEKLPFNEILSEAQSYIVAGSDTTANTLTYLTWSVCRRPDVRSKLVRELRGLPSDFDEAQLPTLPYLNHIVDETLRLYSAAPSGLPRVVPPGGAELAGYRLDAGTVVCAQAYSMHRDPLVFPSPDSFLPERWAEPTKAMKDAFMPFGRGPRVCIGQHLARMELRLATARFFLAFPEAHVSSLEGMSDDDMKPRIHFLLTPSGGRCLVQAR
ncbi:hypothetical protein XA68_14482 [Ophiocordyceps unilateralis]|uniref:Cytochrome P450 n=1 Tax=Ophiocordyceps unilateralis TaxID=268505 RepID=A0A2A9P9F4_OPHUN|nr:hypothetical protein XA68_14482 [Ophiocordyceps unilateralis]